MFSKVKTDAVSPVPKELPGPCSQCYLTTLDIEVRSCAITARSQAAGDHVFGKIADTGTSIDFATRGRPFVALPTYEESLGLRL